MDGLEGRELTDGQMLPSEIAGQEMTDGTLFSGRTTECLDHLIAETEIVEPLAFLLSVVVPVLEGRVGVRGIGHDRVLLGLLDTGRDGRRREEPRVTGDDRVQHENHLSLRCGVSPVTALRRDRDHAA